MALKDSLQHLLDNDIRTRGEFQLTDALQMMIEKGCKFRTAPVQEWLDCGLPETLIQTNTWLLQNKHDLDNTSRATNGVQASIHCSKLIPPCVIGNNVTIDNCTIGPNVTIGNNCKLKNVTMNDCIVWDNEDICDTHIEKQIVASC